MEVPGTPRIFLTAFSTLMSLVLSPSTLRIRSPALIPARQAGVSSIGEITVRTSFLRPIVMPRPPNSPLVSTCISLNMSSVM